VSFLLFFFYALGEVRSLIAVGKALIWGNRCSKRPMFTERTLCYQYS
jgi:hypothetical protein